MSETAAAPVVPKRRRRWLRFGLRTFLVVVALAGVTLGWKVRQVRQQRAAVEWVRENDGAVIYDFEWDEEMDQVIPHPHDDPPAPSWPGSLVGVDFVARPASIKLGGYVDVFDVVVVGQESGFLLRRADQRQDGHADMLGERRPAVQQLRVGNGAARCASAGIVVFPGVIGGRV